MTVFVVFLSALKPNSRYVSWEKYPLGSNYRGRESPAISLNRKPELALDYFPIGSQALDIHHKITGIIRSIVAY